MLHHASSCFSKLQQAAILEVFVQGRVKRVKQVKRVKGVAGHKITIPKIPEASPDEKLTRPVSECSGHAAAISWTCAGNECLWLPLRRVAVLSLPTTCGPLPGTKDNKPSENVNVYPAAVAL